jgi:hypothetical protein
MWKTEQMDRQESNFADIRQVVSKNTRGETNTYFMQIVWMMSKKQITNIKSVSARNHFLIIVITQYPSGTDQNTTGLHTFNKEIIY